MVFLWHPQKAFSVLHLPLTLSSPPLLQALACVWTRLKNGIGRYNYLLGRMEGERGSRGGGGEEGVSGSGSGSGSGSEKVRRLLICIFFIIIFL
jgi:hypothetical protein